MRPLCVCCSRCIMGLKQQVKPGNRHTPAELLNRVHKRCSACDRTAKTATRHADSSQWKAAASMRRLSRCQGIVRKRIGYIGFADDGHSENANVRCHSNAIKVCRTDVVSSTTMRGRAASVDWCQQTHPPSVRPWSTEDAMSIMQRNARVAIVVMRAFLPR